MTKLTAVIITKNAENAKDTKKTLNFADEVLVEEHPDIENFSKARNQALKKANSEWVLFVDDDEEVTKDLAKEIQEAIKSEKYDGYYLNRVDHFLNRNLKYGETGNIELLRLARRSKGQFHRPVHE